MKNFKDKKIIILASVLVTFTLLYFTVVLKISYAFEETINVNDIFEMKMDTIKKCAIAYAEKNNDKFEDDILYIKVQDLIDSGMLVPSENGNIENPLKENETLNSNMIKIKKEGKKFVVVIDN